MSSLFLGHTVVRALPRPEERHIDVRERKVRLVRKPAMQEVAGSNPVAHNPIQSKGLTEIILHPWLHPDHLLF